MCDIALSDVPFVSVTSSDIVGLVSDVTWTVALPFHDIISFEVVICSVLLEDSSIVLGKVCTEVCISALAVDISDDVCIVPIVSSREEVTLSGVNSAVTSSDDVMTRSGSVVMSSESVVTSLEDIVS